MSSAELAARKMSFITLQFICIYKKNTVEKRLTLLCAVSEHFHQAPSGGQRREIKYKMAACLS